MINFSSLFLLAWVRLGHLICGELSAHFLLGCWLGVRWGVDGLIFISFHFIFTFSMSEYQQGGRMVRILLWFKQLFLHYMYVERNDTFITTNTISCIRFEAPKFMKFPSILLWKLNFLWRPEFNCIMQFFCCHSWTIFYLWIS